MRIGNALLWMFALGLTACAAPSSSGGATGGEAPRAAAAPAPVSAATLVGTRWVGVADASVDKRHLPWLEFVAEGRVSGYTGCNLLHGGWRNDAGTIRFGPLVTTKRGCAGPEGDMERRVLAVLNEQSRVSREGDKLVISAAGGERLEFVQAK